MRNSPLVSIKKKGDFNQAFGCGKSAACSLFVVYAVANNLGYNRLGLSVSKKVGCAPRRNRVKRLVKENCRIFFNGQAMRGYDLLVIARVPSGQLPREGSFAKVGDHLMLLFKRLGVLK